jgi:UDP-N-acetylglucosamine transferase subunit ALG13
LALSFLPSTLTRRGGFHYIESAARADAPSMTGRVMARTPRVRRYAQYPWFGNRWIHVGSVFDSFRPGPRRATNIERVVVSAGTTDSYGFRRLFAHVVRILPPEVEVLWQTGSTDMSGLRNIRPRPEVPPAELAAAIMEADVVISHAGAGSALTALELGQNPILVPRESAFGEHIDDHQQQIARELDRRGLALCRSVGQLDYATLLGAAGRTVETVADPAPFPLVSTRSLGYR